MMKRSVSWLKKLGVLLVGLPIIALGIVLIPLPGPGLLVCLLGFFILSLEFEWADRYFQKIKLQLKKIVDASKAKTGDQEKDHNQDKKRS